MHLQVAVDVRAPVTRVWDALVDWEAQAQWMMDARGVTVVTPQRTGRGVTIHVPTTLLGLPVLDVMRITGWDPPHRLEATHLGRFIKGVGIFELHAVGSDGDDGAGDAPATRSSPAGQDGVTRVVWSEEIVAPLGRVGEIGARLVLPLLEAIFTRSLRRFKHHAEATGAEATGVDATGDVA